MNDKIKTIGFYFVYPLFNLYYKCLKKKFPKVINSKRTLEILIETRKSLARFGDGELNLILGRDIGFQVQNYDLAIELKRVLQSSNERCLIGIPDVFNGLGRFRPNAKFFWLYSVVNHWNEWKSLIQDKSSYVDSLCSRFYMDLKDKHASEDILSYWKKLWTGRDIVIVEGEHTKMGVGNDLFDSANSIRRIICPSKNAFDSIDKIHTEITKLDKNALILIALGPTASVLAYDISMEGYQAIDTGHLDLEYNWLINKSRNKEAVAGRMVNEIHQTSFKDIQNKEYMRQIIAHVAEKT